MKFGQQFEINKLYVCTKFRGNRSRDFGFKTRKLPRRFGVQSGLIQKRLLYFIGLYVLRHPFIPTNPLSAAMRFISFFSFFSSLILYALLLLNHKTWKFNFCVKLLSCICNFFSQNFLGQLHREPAQNGAKKSTVLTAQTSLPVFYDTSRYLPHKYFDVVWGCHPLGTPQNQFFWIAQLRMPVWFDISRYLTDKYFDIFWGCHSPPGDPPIINFLNGSN